MINKITKNMYLYFIYIFKVFKIFKIEIFKYTNIIRII